MESFRRGLALAILLPSTALAEVCDKERPHWDGHPTSTYDELLAFIQSPAAWILFGLAAVCLLLRSRWFALPCLFWGAILLANFLTPLPSGFNDIHMAAIKEGCIGNPVLSISLTVAICALAIWRLFRRSQKQEI